ncbi:HD-GYP domain-containing protein [Pseudomonadota bacterium]
MASVSNTPRAVTHYLITLIVIGLYGAQVCPFIESLSFIELATPLTAIVAFQFLLHRTLNKWLINKAPYKNQVARAFKIEWCLFFGAGLVNAIYNSLIFDFPIESGLKMVIGFSAIGFFIATDLALERERQLAAYIHTNSISLTPERRFFTLIGKFTLFASAVTTILVSIFFLLINKDLIWLEASTQHITFEEAQRSVLIEFLFVGSILLAYTITVIRSYALNLKHFIGNQNHALAEATSGHLDHSITVSSNDEFGVMAHQTNIMIKALKERTEALQKTQDVTILSLASLAETRDNETGAHILRTQRYVRALAMRLRNHPRFKNELNDETISLFYKSAPLHDIGKVGIPDAILLKPGKLDVDEFEIMKTHATLGGEALERAEEALGGSSFLRHAKDIANTHHEKWNGSGYPLGLKGDEIPVCGRLMAVADVYDALISKRVYKPAFSHEKAIAIIKEGNGLHFDPDVVEAMLAIEDEFKQIAADFADEAYGEKITA